MRNRILRGSHQIVRITCTRVQQVVRTHTCRGVENVKLNRGRVRAAAGMLLHEAHVVAARRRRRRLTQDGRKPEAARQFRSQTRGLPGRAGACDSFYLNIDRLSGRSRSLRLQSAWHKAQALSHPAPPTGRRGPGDPGGLPRGRFRGQRRPRCHPPRSPLPAGASSPRAAEGLRPPLPHRRALSRALVTILAPTAPSQLQLQTGPRPPPTPALPSPSPAA